MKLKLNSPAIIAIIFATIFRSVSTTDSVTVADESSKTAPAVDLESENYDPYAAQAPAAALRQQAMAAAAAAGSAPYPSAYAPHPQTNHHAHGEYLHYPSSSNQHNQNTRQNARLEAYDEDIRRNNPYDPFYFFGRQRVHPVHHSHGVGSASPAPNPVTIRHRRNSRLYVNNNNGNNLLSDNVYFFRRKNSPGEDRTSNKEKLKIFEDSPYYHRQATRYHDTQLPLRPEIFKYYGVNQQPAVSPRGTYNNPFENRGYNRGYPPTQSNQIDYFDHPRNRELAREPLHRGAIDGWSVQVGTQLKVHDDGQSRNPGQHYVRDERPGGVRGYPYHTDRQ